MNEQKLGATVEDRQRLRWKPDPGKKPEDEKAAGRTSSRASRPDARLHVVKQTGT